jgi:hypothetical protein
MKNLLAALVTTILLLATPAFAADDARRNCDYAIGGVDGASNCRYALIDTATGKLSVLSAQAAGTADAVNITQVAGATVSSAPGSGILDVRLTAGGTQVGNVHIGRFGIPAEIDAEVLAIAVDTDIEPLTASQRLLGYTAYSVLGGFWTLRADTVAGGCDGIVASYIVLAAGQATTVMFGTRGLDTTQGATPGLCIDRTAGTLDAFTAFLVIEPASS